MGERDNNGDEALKASKDALQKIIKWELKHNPRFLYYVGETLLVCIAKTKKTVKGKKTTLRGPCEGLILKADNDLDRYVDFDDLNTIKQQNVWVKADGISLTKEEEKRKEDTAKKEKQKRLRPENCTSTHSNSKHVKLTNDVSKYRLRFVLKNLKQDTINLCFDFPRQRSLSKWRSVSLASSYFYASLHEPENMPSYTKCMKKPIAELQASYYTCAPSNWGTLVAYHHQHHQPLYIHLLLCQLSKEQIPINIPNHETKVYQERTENPATTTMYAVTWG